MLPVPADESASAAKNGGHTQATVQIQIKLCGGVDDNMGGTIPSEKRIEQC